MLAPGVLMTLVHEQLVFEPRPQHGVSLPIDQFMRSLASSMAERAIGAVLPPEALAQKVLSLTRGEAGRLMSGELVGLATAKPALQRLFERLRHRSGVDFAQYELPTMMRRIERRMAVLGCASVPDDADEVARSDDECELLRRELLIPVTGFFRDPAAPAATPPAPPMRCCPSAPDG